MATVFGRTAAADLRPPVVFVAHDTMVGWTKRAVAAVQEARRDLSTAVLATDSAWVPHFYVFGYRQVGDTVVVPFATAQCLRTPVDGITASSDEGVYRFVRDGGAWRSLGRSATVTSDGACRSNGAGAK